MQQGVNNAIVPLFFFCLLIPKIARGFSCSDKYQLLPSPCKLLLPGTEQSTGTAASKSRYKQ